MAEDWTRSGERRLRASGRRMTSQRRLILEVLSQAEGHLDAGDIYQLARNRDPRVSLATVYRTLGAMKEAGLVRELHLDDEHHHYEIDTQDQHSHLVCIRCGCVVEVDSRAFADVARAAGRAQGFEVTSTHVELAGYCAACRREAGAAR